MPRFETPEPISIVIDLDLAVGEVRVLAAERTDTVVEVRPSRPNRRADVRLAERTTVDFADGELRVRAEGRQPRGLRTTGSVDVTVEAPAGSRLVCLAAVAQVYGTGRLGSCRVETHAGNVALERTGDLDVSTSAGDVRVTAVEGAAVVRSTKGVAELGEVTGQVRVAGVHGDIRIGRAAAGVEVRTVRGDVRVAEVVRGLVDLNTVAGQLDVGIREGTAVKLDLSSISGGVRNELSTVAGPQDGEEIAEVRARAAHGQIVIHRAAVVAS